MASFIKNASNKFAQIIHFDPSKFQELNKLKQRFDIELLPYQIEETKIQFLENLQLELNK